MALKDDARAVANDASDLLTDLNVISEEVRADLGALSERLTRLVDRAGGISDLIPTPDAARGIAAAASYKLAQNHDDPTWRTDENHDYEALADDAENYTLIPKGRPVDRTDRTGMPLASGDLVRVVGSDRYGNPTAVVRGPGPDAGDGKQRVLVSLTDGRDDRYTPSTGRVERLLSTQREPAEVSARNAEELTLSELAAELIKRLRRIGH